MTAKVEKIISDIDSLSSADFKLVQDHLADKMEEDPSLVDLSKISYRLSPKTIEGIIAQFLTPEELAELDDSELDDFPTLPKTITEYINEDREDRL